MSQVRSAWSGQSAMGRFGVTWLSQPAGNEWGHAEIAGEHLRWLAVARASFGARGEPT
jgi:hypothetical protein